VIKSSSWKSQITSLPSECRPTDGKASFAVNHNDFAHRIDVSPNGDVVFISGTRKYAWLSLDGIIFHVKPSQPINVTDSFSVIANDYRLPSVSRQGSYCLASGLIGSNSNNNDSFVTQLPFACRPKNQLMFGTSDADGMNLVSVSSDGSVSFLTSKRRNEKYLSLDQIHFVTSPMDETMAAQAQEVDRLQLVIEFFYFIYFI